MKKKSQKLKLVKEIKNKNYLHMMKKVLRKDLYFYVDGSTKLGNS